MKNSKSRKSSLLTIALILSTLLNACTSYQDVGVNTPEALAQALAVGDRVEVTTVDGAELAFVIEEKTAQGIKGEESFVNFDEISQVRVKEMDEEKVKDATMLAVSVPLIVLGVGLLILLSGGAAGIPGY